MNYKIFLRFVIHYSKHFSKFYCRFDFIYYLLFENKSNLKINRNLFTLQLTKMVKLICIKGRYVKVDIKTFLHASHVVCLIENKSALTFDAGVSKPTMSIVMRIMKINID